MYQGKGGELMQPGGKWIVRQRTLPCGTGVKRNYVWCLDIVVIFIGFEGAKKCKSFYRIPLFTISCFVSMEIFDVNIDNYAACQEHLAMYAVAKFDKAYLNRGLNLYNRKIGKSRSSIKNVLKFQQRDYNWIIVYAMQFLSVSIIVIQTPLPTDAHKCIYWKWKPITSEWIMNTYEYVFKWSFLLNKTFSI